MKEPLIEKLGFNRIKLNEPLAGHVQIKVGGPADFFYETRSSEELVLAVKAAIEERIPFTLLGNGANVLVSDKGVRGLVIKNHSKNIKFLPHGFVEADSGVDNTVLTQRAKERNLSGMERLLKVPGTIGGAVYMNAGDTGRKEFFGDLVISVEVVDKNGNVKKIKQEACDFAYRSSRFQKTAETILKVKLQLTEASKEEIDEKVKDILVRKMYHPSGASVGSTFRNPENYHSGQLIEKAGLKGKKIGNAKISEKHANFIINEGNAKASDVKSLIDLMKQSVKEKFGVDLEEEVRYIGEWQ